MPKTGSNTSEKQIEFLTEKLRQLEPLLLFHRFCAQDAVLTWSLSIAYREALDKFKAGAMDKEVRAWLQDEYSKGNWGIGHADVLMLLETGKPYLPRDLLELPKFVLEQKQKSDEALKAKFKREEAEREAERLHMIAEEKKRKRAELAEHLGIKPEALEQLAGGGKSAAPPES